MNRNAVLVLPLVALLAALLVLLLLDPLGWVSGRDLSRPDDTSADGGSSPDAGPTLAGRVVPGQGEVLPRYLDGVPVGQTSLGLGTAGVRGLVTGEGRPLAGAAVRVALTQPARTVDVRTRPDGSYEVLGLPATAADVRAVAAGWRGRTVTTPGLADGQVLDIEPLDLDPSREAENVLVVRVLDEIGRPLPDAKVLATTTMWALQLAGGAEVFGEHGTLNRVGRTNVRGEVRLEHLPPETYDVVVLASGYRVEAQPQVAVGRDTTKTLVFRLVPGVTIEGLVVDAEDRPVEGAFVTGLHQPSFANTATARTAADGSFLLEGLRPGTYMVIAGDVRGGEVVQSPVRAPSAGLRLKLGGTGLLVVTVKRSDGKAVPHYRLRPWRSEPFGYVFSLSHAADDAGGRFEIPLPRGTYHLSVQTDAGEHDASVTATIEVGETTEVSVTLPQPAVVRGVVVDPDGRHVAGAEVFVRHGGFPTGPTRELYTRTDANGAFRLSGLPPESLKLHVRHEHYAPAVAEVQPSTEGDGPEITVRLGAGATIEGRVTQGGEPHAGEQVNLFAGFNVFEARTTVTDAEGRYRFDAVGLGTWSVSTGPLEPASPGIMRSGIAVTQEGATIVVDLEGSALGGSGIVEGRVRQGDTPVPGVRVTVIDQRGWERSVSTVTDGAGAFRAEGLQPGAARAVASTAAGTSSVANVTIPEDGTPAQVEIVLGGSTVGGRLTTADGDPVSGVWVQIEVADDEGSAGWGRVRATAISDQNGLFSATGLGPGSYRLRVSGGSQAGMLGEPFEVLEGSSTVDLGTFRLAPGVALQGRVTTPDGRPVEDATISLEDSAGRQVQLFSMVTTGSDGRYRVAGLAEGWYEVRVEARGLAPATVRAEVAAGGGQADLVLQPGGEIEVRVVDPGGEPREGVRVSLRDAVGQRVRRTLSLVNLEDPGVGSTDAQGFVRLRDLAPGRYTIEASLAGHVPQGSPPAVDVTSAGIARATVTLVPAE